MHRSLTVLALLALGSAARGQDAARAIIAKGIAAHGGAANIDRYPAVQARAQSKIFLSGLEIPVRMETFFQFPDQMKIVMDMDVQGKKVAMIQILDGEQAWVNIDGKTDPANPAMLAQLKDATFAARVVRLTPLLRDPGFELAFLGEVKFEDRPQLGVKVGCKGYSEIRLFFDKDSNLLVRTEKAGVDTNMKDVVQEDVYSDFREVQGVKRPMKVRINHDGKKFLDGEMVDVRLTERLDSSIFARP